MAKLRVEQGKSQGKVVEIDRQAVIGRGETAQLQINDLKASREHCKVFEQAGSWAVADLNSRNGIKVNGVQTTRKTLAHGDRIEIGETVMVFEMGPAAGGGGAETGDLPAAKAGAAETGDLPASSVPSRPALKAAPTGAAARKAAAMADARASAAKAAPAGKPAAGGAATKAPRAGQAAGTGKGVEISDRVLQFHKVDPRKATVMDVDLTQSPGVTKFLIFLGCAAFLGGFLWIVLSMLGD